MWALASVTVDANSPYAYLMVTEFFADTSAVAVADDEVLGMVIGFRLPEDPETLFVWQVAVAGSARGEGLANELLDAVVNRPVHPRLRQLSATVTPDNDASDRLFRAFAERWEADCAVSELFARSDFPAQGGHEAEHRYDIGPF